VSWIRLYLMLLNRFSSAVGVAETQAVLIMATADGSWDLTIFITDLNVEQTIHTRGDLHVGGLMLKLANAIGN